MAGCRGGAGACRTVGGLRGRPAAPAGPRRRCPPSSHRADPRPTSSRPSTTPLPIGTSMRRSPRSASAPSASRARRAPPPRAAPTPDAGSQPHYGPASGARRHRTAQRASWHARRRPRPQRRHARRSGHRRPGHGRSGQGPGVGLGMAVHGSYVTPKQGGGSRSSTSSGAPCTGVSATSVTVESVDGFAGPRRRRRHQGATPDKDRIGSVRCRRQGRRRGGAERQRARRRADHRPARSSAASSVDPAARTGARTAPRRRRAPPPPPDQSSDGPDHRDLSGMRAHPDERFGDDAPSTCSLVWRTPVRRPHRGRVAALGPTSPRPVRRRARRTDHLDDAGHGVDHSWGGDGLGEELREGFGSSQVQST